MKATLFWVMAGCGLAFSAVSCGEADELKDCQEICSRYQDCFDEDYDVDSCRSQCENSADEDEDFATKTDTCESCLDDKSCTGSFACVDECAGIVP